MSVDAQPSGAYLFRPTEAAELPTRIAENSVELSVVRGKVVSEVRQKFGDWATQIVRLTEGE